MTTRWESWPFRRSVTNCVTNIGVLHGKQNVDDFCAAHDYGTGAARGRRYPS
jgi:hypothetical protein